MSIENELARIATALETIVACLPGTQKAAVTKEPVQPIPPPGDVIPGEEKATEVNVMGPAVVANAAELRAFVQKYLVAAEPLGKANDLVTYVRDTVCKKFNPKEPKLIKIPDANVKEAAQMVYNWCFERNIIAK